MSPCPDDISPHCSTGDFSDQDAIETVSLINRHALWLILGPSTDFEDPPPPLPPQLTLIDLINRTRRVKHLNHKASAERVEGQTSYSIHIIPDPRLIAAVYVGTHYDTGTPEKPNVILLLPSPKPGKVIALCSIETTLKS